MKKYLLSFILFSGLAIISHAQDTRQKLDKIKNDPVTTERTAKADSRVIDKKNIVDSSGKVAAKEKGCRHKKKKK